jgi:hypothetical protein
MNPSEVKALFEDQGVQADPKHLAAAATTATFLLKGTAERSQSCRSKPSPRASRTYRS